ncbi:expressed unknown protein [Seminavis robusta]|uniref:RNI-like protein n=1 Tax=Seminavis robusta TaxID=568900 RepID=A0A9N8E5T0_9STRA|nr:expressed unknown protein [Seminavis robusta]|eukprot:Sro527_g160690.1 n/a (447) ;mRNA; f:39011-40351
MTTSPAAKLGLLRDNDPNMTDLDVWLNGDENFMGDLTAALHGNNTVNNATFLCTCPSTIEEGTRLGDEKSKNRLMALLKSLGSIPTIRKFCITGPTSPHYSFPIQGLAQLLQHARKCTRFSVGRMITNGTEEEWTQFAGSLQSHDSLEELYFNGSILFGGASSVPLGQERLLEAVGSMKALKIVTLNGLSSHVGNPSSTPKNVSVESMSSLCQSASLTKLLIYDFTLTDDHLGGIAQAIQANNQCQLKEIRLSSCHVGSQGILALGKLLSIGTLQLLHVWIKELESDDRGATKASCLFLADSLQTSQLRDFRLMTSAHYQSRLLTPTQVDQQHPICHPHMQAAFCHAIGWNYHLETFSMLCGFSHHAEIAFYLKLNKLGRRRLFCSREDPTSIQTKRQQRHRSKRARSDVMYNRRIDWVEVLIDSLHDLSCLYYFLSMNPSLCHSS